MYYFSSRKYFLEAQPYQFKAFSTVFKQIITKKLSLVKAKFVLLTINDFISFFSCKKGIENVILVTVNPSAAASTFDGDLASKRFQVASAAVLFNMFVYNHHFKNYSHA
jgi:hypothetical protein